MSSWRSSSSGTPPSFSGSGGEGQEVGHGGDLHQVVAASPMLRGRGASAARAVKARYSAMWPAKPPNPRSPAGARSAAPRIAPRPARPPVAGRGRRPRSRPRSARRSGGGSAGRRGRRHGRRWRRAGVRSRALDLVPQHVLVGQRERVEVDAALRCEAPRPDGSARPSGGSRSAAPPPGRASSSAPG